MSYRFVEGKAYEAIPALKGAQRRLVVCTGRNESRVLFAWTEDVSVENVDSMLGREFVKAKRPDGVYTMSAALPVDTESAAIILDTIRERKAV